MEDLLDFCLTIG